MRFLNRITGKTIDKLPENIILGEWLIINQLDNLKVNNVDIPINCSLYLWADSSNHIYCQGLDKILIPKWQIPSEILRESISYFFYQFNHLNFNEDNWQSWLNLSPLVPEINDKIHLQSLEIELQKHWGHLETVCRRPRTYLKIVDEKLPISRAQKMAGRALEDLASHSQDWYSRNFNSVKPNKLLCIVREDLLNIYENQVTARLIDNLLEYIYRRVAELKLIKYELDETVDFSDKLQKIYWKNRQRITSLWGEQFDAEIGLLEIEETLEELDDKKRKLLGLISTNLYQEIPRQTYVSMTLKRTNIFINDQHYKYVDLLWRNWSQWKTGQIKNPQQLWQEYQHFFQGFNAFCLLLICKTLSGSNDSNHQSLSFQPVFDIHSDQNNLHLSFQGLLGNIDLSLSENNIFNLHSELTNQDLSIIPLAVNLTQAKNEVKINKILDKLISNLDKNTHNIILYLGTKEEEKLLSKDLQKRLNNISFQNQNFIGIFSVSPFEIISLERVAYGVQFWLYGNLYLSYPPILKLPFNIPDNLFKYFTDYVETNNNQDLKVLALINTDKINSFNQELNKQINSVESRGKQGKAELELLRNIQEYSIYDEIVKRIKPFTICPVCNHQEDLNSLKRLNNHSFECSCSQCQSRWGIKHCGNCDHNYPFIELQGMENQEINFSHGNFDQVFGRNILTIPHRKDDGNISFVCCFCCAN